MGAGHDHGLGEVQHEEPLWWAFGLTAAFLVAEVVGGLVTNSLALLSDAAHMATEGSPPFSRTLTRRPIEAMRSVHVEAKEVQCGVQARCG